MKPHPVLPSGRCCACIHVEQAGILREGQHEAVVDCSLIIAQLVLRPLIAESDLQHTREL